MNEPKQFDANNSVGNEYNERQYSTTIGVADNATTLPDFKPHNTGEFIFILVVFVIMSAVLGLAHDIHTVATSKEELPKKDCGVKIHWGLTFLVYSARFVINGFMGLCLGWATLYFFNAPIMLAIAVAGIAGGQGSLLYNLLVSKLYNRVDKSGDVL